MDGGTRAIPDPHATGSTKVDDLLDDGDRATSDLHATESTEDDGGIRATLDLHATGSTDQAHDDEHAVSSANA